MKAQPPLSYLKECFNYAPDTGVLSWKSRPESHFANSGYARNWNGKYAGIECGSRHPKHGYLNIQVWGQKYQAHRLIWKIMTGEEPNVVDHINGDTRDNRWNNLRSVTPSQSSKNVSVRHASKSGVTGVSMLRCGTKWQAYIASEGIQIHLGFHDKFDDAVAARKVAEIKYGFHKNHGRKRLQPTT